MRLKTISKSRACRELRSFRSGPSKYPRIEARPLSRTFRLNLRLYSSSIDSSFPPEWAHALRMASYAIRYTSSRAMGCISLIEPRVETLTVILAACAQSPAAR
jgi:hypothetical protein